jgi:hypothetical protein
VFQREHSNGQSSRAGIIVFVLLQQANGVCCRWTR